MKIAPYVEKLNASKQYHEFMKSNGDAFIVAGFFVLDYDAGHHIHQIDFYVPSKKKIAAFTLDGGVTMQLLSVMAKKKPEKLDIQTKTDLDALKGILGDEMKNRNITEEVRKIIAVVQTVEGKKIWSLNCILSGMGILHASIEDTTQSVLKMEKSSMFDYIKQVPGSQLAAMRQGMGQQANQAQTPGAPHDDMPQAMQQDSLGQVSPDEISTELKKLDKISAAIEKEKALLTNQLSKKAGKNSPAVAETKASQTLKKKASKK
ncbi:MAG TPA: hypothetical protein VJK03_04745 [Candidatus Nanoarchaeia archaeon]|nr:hypothetical protein [Candidatus Nanoarchaeia archaeon]